MADLAAVSSSVGDDLAVVLLGPAAAARAVRGVGPRTVTAADADEAADAAAVIGVAVEPWPAFAAAHEEVRAAVAPAPYFAVQAWHRHPAYLERLAGALTGALASAGAAPGASVGSEAHVLFTAPGPSGEVEPGDVVFLRETAEAVSDAVGLRRRSIAWTSGTLGPSSLLALTALAEAHGRQAVVRCSLDPLARPDDVAGEAASLGFDLTDAWLDPIALPAMLDAVVATVVEHEGLGGGGR